MRLLMPISIIVIFFLAFVSASGKSAEISTSSPAGKSSQGAELEAYVDPDTGEILTREQWQNLGLDADQHSTDTGPSDEKDPAADVVEAKIVTLPDGSIVIGIDTRGMPGTETKVRFDENGKAHLSHH